MFSFSMKWDMEIEEIEAILEKIWDLHDKLSDAIHSISRAHFLSSIKTLRPDRKASYNDGDVKDHRSAGFVFVKDFQPNNNDDESAMIQEAKSLNVIRSALENLEEQLDFFHTVQTQQRAERDAAIARLEQSRIVLAMRLADHHGKKYTVIEEALAFVGDVNDAGRFVSPENLYGPPITPSGNNLVTRVGKGSNVLIKVLISSFDFVKKSFGMDHMSGIMGNVAMVAVSMTAFLLLHQVSYKENPNQEDNMYGNRNVTKSSRLEGTSSSAGHLSHFDVLLARG